MPEKLWILFFCVIVCDDSLYSQTIKGKLYFDLGGGKSKDASDLVVYLIPGRTENKKLIKTISQYEAACNEDNIKTAKQYRITVTDKEGNFFFNNIGKGKYLVKVCVYYGGYYNINIKRDFKGTITLPRFEADPPLKGD